MLWSTITRMSGDLCTDPRGISPYAVRRAYDQMRTLILEGMMDSLRISKDHTLDAAQRVMQDAELAAETGNQLLVRLKHLRFSDPRIRRQYDDAPDVLYYWHYEPVRVGAPEQRGNPRTLQPVLYEVTLSDVDIWTVTMLIGQLRKPLVCVEDRLPPRPRPQSQPQAAQEQPQVPQRAAS